jgi:hypothetical protein
VLARVFRGYAPDAVDDLLRSVAEASEQARKEIRELNEQAHRLGAELDEVLQPERELRETFVVAEREAAKLRTEAARKADAIRAEARGRAQERVAWLEAESVRIRSELERMRGAENELHESMRLVLLDALRNLDEPPERSVGAKPEEPAPRNGTLPAVAIPEERVAEPPEETIEMPAFPGRLDEPAEPPPVEREAEARPPPSRSLLYATGILVAAVGIGVAIWQLRAPASEPASTTTAPVGTTAETAAEPSVGGADAPAPTAAAVETAEPPATTEAEPPATTEAEPAATTAQGPAAASPSRFALLLRAAGGDCWLSVRTGSANGRLLFEGFLFSGESRRFEAQRVWMRVGNGGNLAARLNGEPLRGLPAGTGDVLVTADGVRTLALG